MPELPLWATGAYVILYTWSLAFFVPLTLLCRFCSLKVLDILRAWNLPDFLCYTLSAIVYGGMVVVQGLPGMVTAWNYEFGVSFVHTYMINSCV